MSVLEVTKDNFTETIKSGTVLLDFGAQRCGPCRALAPIIEEIAEETDDVTFGKVDADEEFELTLQFGIRNIPTLLLFRDGELERRSIGLLSKDEVLEFISK